MESDCEEKNERIGAGKYRDKLLDFKSDRFGFDNVQTRHWSQKSTRETLRFWTLKSWRVEICDIYLT